MLMLSRMEASAITGVPAPTIGTMQQRGAIASSGQLSAIQVLAIAVSRGLAARGVPPSRAGAVLSYLWAMPLEALEACFDRGERYIAVFERDPLPQLLAKAAITEYPCAPSGPAYLAGLLPILVDVEAIWRRIQAKVGLMETARGERNHAAHRD